MIGVTFNMVYKTNKNYVNLKIYILFFCQGHDKGLRQFKCKLFRRMVMSFMK